eukprot:Nk52_evm1s1385 gene=Nk52_evmTU1s1385
MASITSSIKRSWNNLFAKPQFDASVPLIVFFYEEEALQEIHSQLSRVDAELQPFTYKELIEKLHKQRHKLLRVVETVFADCNDCSVGDRDYRLKFPDDVQEELGAEGAFFAPLLFGAECLASGASIDGRQRATEDMRPAAKQLVDAFDTMKEVLRYQSLKDARKYTTKVKASLRHFDRCWSTFENLYVRCIVPLKDMRATEMQQEMAALLSEAVMRGLKSKVISQDMIEDYEPSVMFTVPRLAVLSGLLFNSETGTNLPNDHCLSRYIPASSEVPQIREKLKRLNTGEVRELERYLADAEDMNDENGGGGAGTSTPNADEPRPRRRTINDLFIGISSLSDQLQSGDNTKDFREIMKQTFYLYTQHPLADPNELLEEEGTGEDAQAAGLSVVQEEEFTAFRRLSNTLIENNEAERRELENTLGSVEDGEEDLEEGVPGGEGSRDDLDNVGADDGGAEDHDQVEGLSTATKKITLEDPPQWQSDEQNSCTKCEAPFNMFRRRHHCRNCGFCFCAKCSPSYTPIPKYGYNIPVRVCKSCYATIRQARNSAIIRPPNQTSTTPHSITTTNSSSPLSGGADTVDARNKHQYPHNNAAPGTHQDGRGSPISRAVDRNSN